MRAVAQAVHSGLHDTVVVITASQAGKTDNILNIAGAKLDEDPAPVLFIGPTRSNVEKVIEPRFSAMVRSVGDLRRKTATGKKDTKTQKLVGGVKMRFAWAGSVAELASDPAALVLIDERDRMGDDVGGEGDVVELGSARHTTYADGVTVVTSTPKVGNTKPIAHPTGLWHWEVADPEDLDSPIWRLWQEGSRHEYAIPCAHCREYFIPRLSVLQWPDDSAPDALKDNDAVGLECPRCGGLNTDATRVYAIEHGVFAAPGQALEPHAKGDSAAVVVDADGGRHVVEFGGYHPTPGSSASFWVSGLAGPWKSYGARAAQFLRAVRSKSASRVQTAINTGMGELYRIDGDVPDWQEVAALRAPYHEGDTPTGVQVVTTTMDVQKDRIVYVVRGWGHMMESWLLQHGEIWGETAHNAVWLEAEELIHATFGGYLSEVVLVDSGYNPSDRAKDRWAIPVNQIYDFCYRNRPRARPVKGQAAMDKPLKPSKIDVNINGRTLKQGLQLWHLNTDYFKSWVHSRISWPVGEPGAWHISADATDEYCKQIVNEARVVKPSGGITWLRLGENHYFDCEYMQVAAAHMLQLHNLRKLQQAEEGAKEAAFTMPKMHKPKDPYL